jgi:hypothetical protein
MPAAAAAARAALHQCKALALLLHQLLLLLLLLQCLPTLPQLLLLDRLRTQSARLAHTPSHTCSHTNHKRHVQSAVL